MAFQLPKLDFFYKMNARSRLFVVLGVVAALGLGIYFIVKYFSGAGAGTGTHVAAAPGNLQSVPGGQLSPEYYRAVMQANAQSAQQAKVTGTSAVPTLINIPGQTPPQQQGCANCCCPAETATDTAAAVNALVAAGKLSQMDADPLLNLIKNRGSLSDLAALLNTLVRQGKLTPEQARELLDMYRKQYQNGLVADSAKAMDDLIKSGALPLDAANELLELQRNRAPMSDYADELNRLLQERKISPELAARLLAQYGQQKIAEITKASIAVLQEMMRAGQLKKETADDLAIFEQKNVPLDEFNAELKRLVTTGRIAQDIATKVVDEYREQRAAWPSAENLAAMLKGATAQKRDELQKLLDMQANNAPVGDYSDELKRAVAAGILNADEAARLMRDYRASLGATPTEVAAAVSTAPGGAEFAALQKRVQEKTGAEVTPAAAGTEFAAVAAQANAQALQAQQERIQALMTAMNSQAQQLITSWAPPTQQYVGGTEETAATKATTAEAAAAAAAEAAKTPPTRPLVKGGTISFAVLETAVDSDYPDSPVMATIVEGPLKGAKMLGKMQITSGQDRIALRFSLMNRDDWITGKTMDAYAIDPDTARSVMATSVNYHYLMRYGSLFASSFLTGYASAITNSGSTKTTGVFGTTTTYPPLNPRQKIAVGLGQVGTQLSSSIGSYVNTPPTVRIKAGVGLGILFMGDVQP